MRSMTSTHDVVVLGAGSGGYATALRAAQLGLTVALVEKDKVGGTCLHRGCIPTKAWLHAAEVADQTRESAALGIHATLDRIDPAGIRAYADGVVDRLYRGLGGLVKADGIETVTGEGRLTDEGVQVGDRLLSGRCTVLATGSFARTLGLPVDGQRIITSDHALRLEQLPATAIVLGGGVIGVEFASAWRSLGVEVTVVEALDRLVPAEDPEASKALARAFRRRGITAVTGTPMQSAEVTDDGVRLTLADGATHEAEVLLVAVGRGPVTEGLGFEEAGVRLDRGFVVVDERLATSRENTWAVGDLVPGLQLAHRGFAHGIFVAEEIAHRAQKLDRAPTPVRDREIPKVTYCEPEIASVGHSEESARQAYGEVESYSYNLAGNGRSQILKTAGFVKVVRRTDGPVVGITMVGSRVGELVGEAQLITAWEAYPEEVAALVHAHPTQNEALGEAHLALAGKPLHAHG
ncbi:dihydrolipoyl dehydrogenase [Naumannella sp. ID2617S]|nr:dihydrolipoyl dehydrogenase [Naumannella sp. ID2617S]